MLVCSEYEVEASVDESFEASDFSFGLFECVVFVHNSVVAVGGGIDVTDECWVVFRSH